LVGSGVFSIPLAWVVIAVQVSCLSGIFFKKVRPIVWLAVTSMLLCALVELRLWPFVSAGLLYQLFIFDSRWTMIPQTPPGILFFDGVCGLCNRFIDFVM